MTGKPDIVDFTAPRTRLKIDSRTRLMIKEGIAMRFRIIAGSLAADIVRHRFGKPWGFTRQETGKDSQDGRRDSARPVQAGNPPLKLLSRNLPDMPFSIGSGANWLPLSTARGAGSRCQLQYQTGNLHEDGLPAPVGFGSKAIGWFSCSRLIKLCPISRFWRVQHR